MIYLYFFCFYCNHYIPNVITLRSMSYKKFVRCFKYPLRTSNWSIYQSTALKSEALKDVTRAIFVIAVIPCVIVLEIGRKISFWILYVTALIFLFDNIKAIHLERIRSWEMSPDSHGFLSAFFNIWTSDVFLKSLQVFLL